MLRVRVVPVRERRLPAWLAAGAGGIGLLLVVTNSGPHGAALVGAGLTGALWMLGTLLAPRPKPYVATVEGPRVGRETIGDHAEASIVEAKEGVSVALVWPDGEVFVETATLADAQRLVAMTGASVVDSFTLPVRSVVLHAMKMVFAAIGALACFALATMPYEKAVFAAIVAFGAITTLIHVAEAFYKPRVAVSLGNGFEAAVGSIREHVTLHVTRAAQPKEEARVRVRVLDRGDEPLPKWLARIDGLSTDAYRGELPSRDDLRGVFEDAAAPLDHRLAAARLLVRRYAVPIEEIHDALDDRLRPYFFEVASDDAASVETALERLGPAFRA